MTTRNDILRFFAILLLLPLLFAQLPVTAAAAEETDVGTAWVTIVGAGMQVTPGDFRATASFSLGMPEGMVYTENHVLRIFRVIEFAFDAQAQAYKASWVKGNGITGWAYEFFQQDKYQYYQEPERLAKASYANQREVWDALAVYLMDNALAMHQSDGVSPGMITNGAFPSEPTWFYYPEVAKEQTQAVFTNVPMGQYLCLTNTVYDQNTKKFINHPVSVTILPQQEADGSWYLHDVQVSLKGTNIGLSRTVDQDQVGTGDTVTFTLNIQVPQYQFSADYDANGETNWVEYTGVRNFTLTDVLAPGFTLLEDTIQVQSGLPPGSFTQRVDKPSDGTTKITWDFVYGLLGDASCIQLTYQAKVNDRMAVGTDDNTAVATLSYVRNIDGEQGQITDSVRLWTYGVTLVKADGNTVQSEDIMDDQGNVTGTRPVANANTKYLPGAVFQLSRQIGVYPQTTVETLESDKQYLADILENRGKGEIYTLPIYKKDDGITVEGYGLYLSVANIHTTDDAAGVSLGGLDSGTYLLVETLAPEGYNRLTRGIRFTIPEEALRDGEYYGKRNSLKAFQDEYGQTSENGSYELLIANYRGIQLPETGGMGTQWFTDTGLLMMAAAIFVFLRGRPLKNNESKEIES